MSPQRSSIAEFPGLNASILRMRPGMHVSCFRKMESARRADEYQYCARRGRLPRLEPVYRPARHPIHPSDECLIFGTRRGAVGVSIFSSRSELWARPGQDAAQSQCRWADASLPDVCSSHDRIECGCFSRDRPPIRMTRSGQSSTHGSKVSRIR
jgi:hypothetical protein